MEPRARMEPRQAGARFHRHSNGAHGCRGGGSTGGAATLAVASTAALGTK